MTKKSLKKQLIHTVICLTIIVLLVQCSKNNSGKNKVFTVSGYVLNEAGNAVTNGTVSVNGQSQSLKTDGTFQFTGLSKDNTFKITVNASGFYETYKNVDNIDGSSLKTPITMISKNTLGILSSGGGSVGVSGFRVIAPAGSFTNTDGSIYTGKVTVSSRYIAKNNANIAKLMPGGDFAAMDANGKDGGMRTYGFVATEFTDANGVKLSPNNNVKVAVVLPAGVEPPAAAGGMTWGYNQAAGNWNTPKPIVKTGVEYYLPTTTLFQNIDVFIQFGTLTGTVTCSDGNPGAYVDINIKSKYDEYVTTTNENGKFRVKVESTGGWSYTISASGGNSIAVNNVTAGSTVPVSLTTTECNNAPQDPLSSGTYKINVDGTNYSGPCVSVKDVGTGGAAGNIDVSLYNINSATGLIFYNMPKDNTGSFNILDGFDNVGGSSLYGLYTFGNGNIVATKSGKITKTDSNTFTFTCILYDLDTGKTYAASGSGTYN